MTFLTLNYRGAVLAIALAFVFFILDDFRLEFVLLMLYFLVLSTIATSVGGKYKKKIGVYEKSRGMQNVLFNAAGPLLMALFFFIFGNSGHPLAQTAALLGFAGSVAAITADKFSSEIGVLDGMPRMLFSMKRAKKGSSGAVTILGLFAGFFAALLVALPFALFTNTTPTLVAFIAISVTFGGFFGAVIDSVFGYFEEKGKGNKFTSNLACGVFGSIIGILIFVLI